ncbi:MAG: tRNA (guanosine(37)-N1)-methyltransferase TrmD [Deltaproteobacteria bacterium]|nr:MAG: tRNA (guanosine(37)-N1)-methyltransferase TrmD [Deltaproteobacteria bacterium]
MFIDVLTIFPDMVELVTGWSILKRAIERELLTVRAIDIRDFATDKHRTTDDTPYGGGPGMVMKPEPVVRAIDYAKKERSGRVILLSPQGERFTQAKALSLSEEDHLILVCGRYEGIDERIRAFVDEEISIGDYILTGGELPAFVVIDAVARLLPGVLGNEASTEEESFARDLLEYPQYTRPPVFRNLPVPEILLSGHHEKIRQWRLEMAIQRTRKRYPELYERYLRRMEHKDDES